MIEIFILSLVQGITEFLPISSSSHLILVSNYLKFDNQNLSIDVSLHIGSFLAVITFFRSDILKFLKDKNILFKIVTASIPVVAAGIILIKFDLINQLRDIKIIGWMTLIFGILLYFSDKSDSTKNIDSNLKYKSAILIGIFQMFALIPGVSRSGITITAARLMKFKRVESARISFLLSIPVLGAISFFGILNLFKSGDLRFSFINLFSIFLSFVFSMFTIQYFLKYITKFNLNIFVFYRVVLGLVILILAYL